MQSVTFIGEVQGGQLHIQQPLTDFEGQQVLVTLIVADARLLRKTSGVAGPAHVPGPQAPSEAEIVEDIGRIRRPARASTTVTAEVVSIGRRAPRIHAEED